MLDARDTFEVRKSSGPAMRSIKFAFSSPRVAARSNACQSESILGILPTGGKEFSQPDLDCSSNQYRPSALTGCEQSHRVWPSEIIRSIPEASEVTRPWR